MVRQIFVFIHRWAGLAMTLFLVIVGLTGSVLAFHDELDAWLNPELLTVAKRGAPLLDPFTLREKAAALHPEAKLDVVQLRIEPDRSVRYSFAPETGEGGVMQRLVAFYLDPYTGEALGERPVWSSPSLERKNVMSFLYRLHFALAWPWSWSTGSHSVGAYILGVAALIWTIDCFIAFYLTFPLRLHAKGSPSLAPKSWWSRWKPAWLIKLNAGAYRINFDIHRAFGLWTWAALFIFAWSSVGFNLHDVYHPTMQTLFGLSDPTSNLPARRVTPLETPALGWREAYVRSDALLQAEAAQRGLAIEFERSLRLNRNYGVYVLSARSSGDIDKFGRSYVTIDADTGALVAASFPGDGTARAGDVLSSWLFWIHMAEVFGLPMQIFVCGMGLVITALSVTGVYIWWKKRKARLHRHAAISQKEPASVS